jgi:hypothetical protein
MASKLSTKEVKEAIARGAVIAIPKKGESADEAVARVARKHPGKEVVDPSPSVMAEIKLMTENQKSKEGRDFKDRYYKTYGRVQGYNKIHCAGMKLIPKPVSMRLLDGLVEIQEMPTDPIGEVPEDWDLEYPIAAVKLREGAVVDRRFSIFQIKEDKFLGKTEIGRRWIPNYDGKIHIRDGASWGSSQLKLQPAYAALGNALVDKPAIQAMQALGYAFARARSQDIVNEAKNAFRDLIRMNYNPVRLLVRMCSLWLAAKQVEASGGELGVAGVEAEPNIINIDGAGSIAMLAMEAINAAAQVLYVERAQIGRDTNILETMLTCITAKVTFITKNTDMEGLPTILQMWPEIPNPVLAIYGGTPTTLNYGWLQSGVIWAAIEYYANLMNVHELLKEVLESVLAMGWRPEGDTLLCGHKAVEILLPPSVLQPVAMGPLLMNARHWEEHAKPVLDEPFQVLAWRGCSRYLQWALLYRDICSELGGAESRLMGGQTAFLKRVDMFVRGIGMLNQANIVAEQAATKLGWKNMLGNILRTVRGCTRSAFSGEVKTFCTTVIKHKFAPQWEEALNCTQVLPEGSAALSLLYPVQMLTLVDLYTWIKPTMVINRYGVSDALYTLLNVGATNFGYVVRSAGSASSQLRKTKILTSYRGVARDAQFFQGKFPTGMYYEPVVKMNDATELMIAYSGSIQNAKSQWFISHDSASFDDQLMEMFQEMDENLVDTWDYIGQVVESLGSEADELESEGEEMSQDDAQDIPPTRRSSDEESEEQGELYVPQERADVKTFKMERILESSKDILGYVPRWMVHLKKALDFSSKEGMHSEMAMRAVGSTGRMMLEDDPMEYPAKAVEQEKVPKLMRCVAEALREAMKFSYNTVSPEELAQMEQGALNIASTLEMTKGIWDYNSFVRLTGMDLPEGMTPREFNDGIKSGKTVREVLQIGTVEELEEQAKAATQKNLARLKAALGIGGGTITPGGTHVAQTGTIPGMPGVMVVKPIPEEQPGGPSQAPKEGQSSAVTEIAVAETRPERAKIEDAPAQTTTSSFGGAAASQDNGGRDQPQTTAGASSAEGTSVQVAEAQFKAQEPAEKL